MGDKRHVVDIVARMQVGEIGRHLTVEERRGAALGCRDVTGASPAPDVLPDPLHDPLDVDLLHLVHHGILPIVGVQASVQRWPWPAHLFGRSDTTLDVAECPDPHGDAPGRRCPLLDGTPYYLRLRDRLPPYARK